jgi:hypothetical protein
MDTVATAVRQLETEQPIPALSNDALIILLIQTVNHLSRWITPIHDRTILSFAPRRSEPSAKDLLRDMRDTETRIYALMHAISTEMDPDLDRVPTVARTPEDMATDRADDALITLSEFRRLRESTTSLLRALPDSAWARGGYSRKQRNWTIRELAEFLAFNDRDALRAIDEVLERIGARRGIAAVSRVRLDQIREPFVFPVPRD